MGNRVLAACTVLLYARICQRPVWIDWSEGNYADVGVNAFPLLFNCQSPYYRAAPPDGWLDDRASIVPPIWAGRLRDNFGKVRQELGAKGYEDLSIDVGRTDYDADVWVFGAYTHKIRCMEPLFTGKFDTFSRMGYGEILRSVLDRDLRLNGDIERSIEDYKRQHFGRYTLGVHVRHTDMKIPVDQILKAVRQRLDRIQSLGSASPTLFLATDSQEMIGQFERTFEPVITAPKWFPEAGGRLHLKDCPDRMQNGIEALTDLYLLAACDGLVFSSRSSFGFVASLLSRAAPSQICDIERPRRRDRLKAKLHSIKTALKRTLKRRLQRS